MKKRLLLRALTLLLLVALIAPTLPLTCALGEYTVCLPDYYPTDYVSDPYADYILLPVQDLKGNFSGYLKAGKDLIALDFDAGRLFHEGLAVVRKDGKYGYVNTAGELQIPLIYDYAQDFSGGIGIVTRKNADGKYEDVAINDRGEELYTGERLQYAPKAPKNPTHGLEIVEKDGLMGVRNAQGQLIVPCEYQDLVILPDGQILVDMMGGDFGHFYLYNSEMMPKSQPESSKILAKSSTQKVWVDDKTVTFPMYALEDANGYQTNYVRLRDVAKALQGTKAQFNVAWSAWAGTEVTPQSNYWAVVGDELKPVFSGDRPYTRLVLTVKLPGGNSDPMDAILLTDNQGGGHTYVKLRDLGQLLNFNVDWSAEKGIFIETDKEYTP